MFFHTLKGCDLHHIFKEIGILGFNINVIPNAHILKNCTVQCCKFLRSLENIWFYMFWKFPDVVLEKKFTVWIFFMWFVLFIHLLVGVSQNSHFRKNTFIYNDCYFCMDKVLQMYFFRSFTLVKLMIKTYFVIISWWLQTVIAIAKMLCLKLQIKSDLLPILPFTVNSFQ